MTFPNIRGQDIGLDTESTGLYWYRDKMFGLSIAVGDTGYYWDIRKNPEALFWLREEVPHTAKIFAHNAKHDAHMLLNMGIELPYDKYHCTVVRAALLDEHRLAYDLDSVAMDCVGIGKDNTIWEKLAAIFGGRPTSNSQAPNLHKAPIELVEMYAAQDAVAALKLGQWQEEKMEAAGLFRVYYRLEHPLLPVLIDMERVGCRVDVRGAEEAIYKLDGLVNIKQNELNAYAGFVVNPNPSGSIHQLFQPRQEGGLWVLNDGTVAPATPAGKASINADVLRAMKHPAAAMILDLRQMIKTRDTFLKGHILGHHVDGIVHAGINQTKSDDDSGTGTGRFSITEPALQQIHKRNLKIASIVRSLFIPLDPQDLWLCGDLSQADMRWFAHYAKDPKIIDKYRNDVNADFYNLLADLTGIPRDADGSKTMMGNTKQISLAAVFGMADGRLAREMGFSTEWRDNPRSGRRFEIPGPEGQAVLDKFNEAVPGIRTYLKDASNVARNRGYVQSIAGRQIRFPHGHSTHKAGGLVLQAGTADSIKAIMLDVHKLTKQSSGSHMLFTVHDETNCSVTPQDRKNGFVEEFQRINENIGGLPCRVPFKCSPVIDINWYIASCKDKIEKAAKK